MEQQPNRPAIDEGTNEIDRRKLVGSGVAAGLLALFPACSSVPELTAEPSFTAANLIADIHCHVFNATDLPIISFIHVVIRERYPRQRGVAVRIEDPDWLDALVGFLVDLIAGNAPTARAEANSFAGRKAGAFRDEGDQTRLASALAQLASAPARSSETREIVPGLIITAQKRERLLREIERETKAVRPRARSADPNVQARALLSSDGFIGRHVRWALLFGKSRSELISILAARYKPERRPVVLMPALIDFSSWLDEQPRSNIADQVQLMCQLARRPGPVRLHPYMPFDPLRDVLHRHKAEPIDPRSVLRNGIKNGAVGVKVYPPMGFRPIGNEGLQFPNSVAEKLERATGESWPARRIGRELDVSLRWLYQWACDEDAPIIAHATASQGAGPEYAIRADPAYWRRVVTTYPSLRLILAHFGRFSHSSEGPFCSSDHDLGEISGTWEHATGCLLKLGGARNAYADLSYLNEVLEEGFTNRPRRERLARDIRTFIRAFDPAVDRLVFGSDWIMLGRERGNENYHGALAAFLRRDVGLEEGALAKVFGINAFRAIGWDGLSKAHSRMVSFYRKNDLGSILTPNIK